MMEITTAADLRDAYDNGERVFAWANLRLADLSGADLSGADLSGAYLRRADLSGAYLGGANLSGADLRLADLSGANLRLADLSGADLSGAYLGGANLSGANLSRADLSGANLSRANLSGANLSRANLSGANLSRANLLVIHGLEWAVFITAATMGIGCQVHTHEDWRGFDDDHIAAMAPGAAAFWLDRRDWLLTECDRIAAEYAERHGADAKKGAA